MGAGQSLLAVWSAAILVEQSQRSHRPHGSGSRTQSVIIRHVSAAHHSGSARRAAAGARAELHSPLLRVLLLLMLLSESLRL